MISFDTPENIRKPVVFWCFQGVSKEISGMKWINTFIELDQNTYSSGQTYQIFLNANSINVSTLWIS